MTDILAIFLLAMVGNLLGYWAGWNAAHRTVATECKRLGAFYVGTTVFKCVEIKEISE
jgi:hypothetical protein